MRIRLAFLFVILSLFAGSTMIHASDIGAGVGAHPITDEMASMWISTVSPDGERLPIAIVYYIGPSGWHDRPWETNADILGAPVYQELVSDEVTLRLGLTLNGDRVVVQETEFDLTEANVFAVLFADGGETTEQVVPLGHFSLRSSSDPASITLLIDYPALIIQLGAYVDQVALDSPTHEPLDREFVRSLLPSGAVTVDIMDFALPSKAVFLSQQMQRSIAEDPAWWAGYVASAPSGEPLPYHPRFGITEAEYEEFLYLATLIEMAKIGEASLHFSWLDEETVQLDGGLALYDLTGIEVDLAAGIVRTPFGTLSEYREISESTSARSALGPWKGSEWRLEEYAGLFSSTIVKFALGRLAESGRGVLMFEATIVRSTMQRKLEHIFYFDLPENAL